MLHDIKHLTLGFPDTLRYPALMPIAKRSRSKTLGQGLLVRMQEPFIAQIDSWIFGRRELMTRPEAIRRLTALGLSASEKGGLAAVRHD